MKGKEKMTKQKYDDEFKARAVAMVQEMGKIPIQVAKELGIMPQSVRDWLRKHEGMQRGDYARIQVQEQEVKTIRKKWTRSQVKIPKKWHSYSKSGEKRHESIKYNINTQIRQNTLNASLSLICPI